MAVVEAAI